MIPLRKLPNPLLQPTRGRTVRFTSGLHSLPASPKLWFGPSRLSFVVMQPLQHLAPAARSNGAPGVLLIGIVFAVLAWRDAPVDVPGVLLGMGLVAATLDVQRHGWLKRRSLLGWVAVALFASSVVASLLGLTLLVSA